MGVHWVAGKGNWRVREGGSMVAMAGEGEYNSFPCRNGWLVRGWGIVNPILLSNVNLIILALMDDLG